MIEVLLFFAAMAAGALNSVAGGGTFIAFPALIFAGVPPIAANATCTIAVWPGALASVLAYRQELKLHQKKLPLMFAVSLIGGAIGAVVLLSTPAQTFEFLIPWLLLVATLLFIGSPYITRYLQTHPNQQILPLWCSILIQLCIAFYGGYFGAGIGILMLAMLSLLGMTHIHEMNALKTVLGSAINGVAVIVFIMSGVVVWKFAIVMVFGAVAGGYLGAHFARKIPKERIRLLVACIAMAMTAYFFLK